MVTAIILIKTDHGKISAVAESLADIREIPEVYSVGGSYDIVAIVRVVSNEAIANVVTERMMHIEGIRNTETMIAYRTYSNYDMERLFSIGMETK